MRLIMFFTYDLWCSSGIVFVNANRRKIGVSFLYLEKYDTREFYIEK